MAFVKIHNANFYYEIHGTGQPVILIAGYCCDHLFWLPILDSLSKNFQVLLFDNRAVGQTTDDNVELTAKLMAEDVIMLADNLNLKKPNIVGHSMGGGIAQTIASLYPEKINKLCLLNTSAKCRSAMLMALRNVFSMRERNMDIDFIIENAAPWLFGEKFFANQNNLAAFKSAILNDPFQQSVNNQRRQLEMLEKFDGVAALANIQAQTLIIHGKEDIISLDFENEFLESQIKHATRTRFDCAHNIIFEIPRELAKRLIDFLI